MTSNKVAFGRHLSSDCVLRHPTVSREHFYIEHNSGKYFLVDRGSGNGTYLNGSLVSWVELKNGDRIQAGPFVLVFEMTEGEAHSPGELVFGTEAVEEVSDSEPFRSYDEGHRQVYPREYLEGIDHFNAGRYFEAHEAWEQVWLRSSGDRKVFYQMLIQAAVGLHHRQRGNVAGALGMYKAVVAKLEQLPSVCMSLDLVDFADQFRTRMAGLEQTDLDAPAPDETRRPAIRLLRGDADDIGQTSVLVTE